MSKESLSDLLAKAKRRELVRKREHVEEESTESKVARLKERAAAIDQIIDQKRKEHKARSRKKRRLKGLSEKLSGKMKGIGEEAKQTAREREPWPGEELWADQKLSSQKDRRKQKTRAAERADQIIARLSQHAQRARVSGTDLEILVLPTSLAAKRIAAAIQRLWRWQGVRAIILSPKQIVGGYAPVVSVRPRNGDGKPLVGVILVDLESEPVALQTKDGVRRVIPNNRR